MEGPKMDKFKVIEKIVKKLEEEIEISKKASMEAFDTATDIEAYSDGKYDTRSLEASYLAGGHAQIVKELGDALQGFNLLRTQQLIQSPSDQVDLGSLLEIKNENGSCWFILGPSSGGLEGEVDDCTVTILTLHSPLGEEVASKKAGESVQTNDGLMEILRVI